MLVHNWLVVDHKSFRCSEHTRTKYLALRIDKHVLTRAATARRLSGGSPWVFPFPDHGHLNEIEKHATVYDPNLLHADRERFTRSPAVLGEGTRAFVDKPCSPCMEPVRSHKLKGDLSSRVNQLTGLSLKSPGTWMRTRVP